MADREDETDRLPDFSFSCWAKIRDDAKDSEDDQCQADESPPQPENDPNPMHLSLELDSVFRDLKMRLEEQDTQLQSGVRKFIDRYSRVQ